MSFRVLYVHIGMLVRVLNECRIHYTRLGQPEVRPKWAFHADDFVLCNIIISMHAVHAKSGKLKQQIDFFRFAILKNLSHL